MSTARRWQTEIDGERAQNARDCWRVAVQTRTLAAV
jgi:hypothetical protein